MQADLSGQKLGGYTLTRLLGKGGMGSVYESYQDAVKRKVAIKVLPQSFAQDAEMVRRFRQEVEVIAALEHPHILPVYDHGTADGINYIVMRYLSGGDLYTRLYTGQPLSLSDIENILTQIGSALDYAHRRGVVHRDLKSQNILFDDEQNAYLADFGIAKLLNATSILTGTGQIIGTPLYMSPEQCNGQPADARSDLYAFGIIAYELLVGRVPFMAETPVAIMFQHVSQAPLPPSHYCPHLSEAVDNVLLKALAKKPEDRFAKASYFTRELLAALRGVASHEVSLVGFEDSAHLRREEKASLTLVKDDTAGAQPSAESSPVQPAALLPPRDEAPPTFDPVPLGMPVTPPLSSPTTPYPAYATPSPYMLSPAPSGTRANPKRRGRGCLLLLALSFVFPIGVLGVLAFDLRQSTPPYCIVRPLNNNTPLYDVDSLEAAEQVGENEALYALALYDGNGAESARWYYLEGARLVEIAAVRSEEACADLLSYNSLSLFQSLGLYVATVDKTAQAAQTASASEIAGVSETVASAVLLNVSTRGGVEVFPIPSRDSTRIFAATSVFKPHVGGRDTTGNWLYIYYFEDDRLADGWAPRRQLEVTDEAIVGLPIIDPNNPPPLPVLPWNEAATR
jgi:serine/threonine protein kinase